MNTAAVIVVGVFAGLGGLSIASVLLIGTAMAVTAHRMRREEKAEDASDLADEHEMRLRLGMPKNHPESITAELSADDEDWLAELADVQDLDGLAADVITEVIWGDES